MSNHATGLFAAAVAAAVTVLSSVAVTTGVASAAAGGQDCRPNGSQQLVDNSSYRTCAGGTWRMDKCAPGTHAVQVGPAVVRCRFGG